MPTFDRNSYRKCRTRKRTIAMKSRAKRRLNFLPRWRKLFVIVLFIMTFVLQNFEIPSSSMEDTLLIGDHVFVNREQFAPPTHWMGPLMPYRDIPRNDIVCSSRREEQGLFLVKRIMAFPATASTCAMASSIATARNSLSHTPSTKWGLRSLPGQFPSRGAF